MTATRYTRDYFCSKCGKKTDRDKLTVKKAVFTDMGTRARTHKSRVISHLCPDCLRADEHWNKEAFSEPEMEAMPEVIGEGQQVIPVG